MKMRKDAKKGSGNKEAKTGAPNIRRFVLIYVGLMFSVFLLIASETVQKVIDINGIYSHWIVIITVGILNGMGISCEYHGSIIQLSSTSLNVEFGCNGLEVVLIYATAVVAFPSTWKNRVVGMLAGVAAIQLMNLVRIVFLAYSVVHFPNLFEYLHIYVAQGIMIAVALGMFLIYIDYANKRSFPA